MLGACARAIWSEAPLMRRSGDRQGEFSARDSVKARPGGCRGFNGQRGSPLFVRMNGKLRGCRHAFVRGSGGPLVEVDGRLEIMVDTAGP